MIHNRYSKYCDTPLSGFHIDIPINLTGKVTVCLSNVGTLETVFCLVEVPWVFMSCLQYVITYFEHYANCCDRSGNTKCSGASYNSGMPAVSESAWEISAGALLLLLTRYYWAPWRRESQPFGESLNFEPLSVRCLRLFSLCDFSPCCHSNVAATRNKLKLMCGSHVTLGCSPLRVTAAECAHSSLGIAVTLPWIRLHSFNRAYIGLVLLLILVQDGNWGKSRTFYRLNGTLL